MSEYSIQIKELSKKFKDFNLDSITLNLEKGSIMGFVGENGAGKTTTIKLLINAIQKDTGTVKILDMDNIEFEREVKEKIGYIADEDYFYSGTVLQSMAKAYEFIYKKWNNEEFMKYVDMWKLPLNKKIESFSKGMKTKAMFALTMGHLPEVLILDEPTAGLDPVARIELLDILREYVSDGEKSVFLSTHITGDLDKIADFVTLIIDGRIAENMSIDAIEDKYAVISGMNTAIEGKEDLIIGLRKGTMTFEGLILRSNLSSFSDISAHTPNIENLLTFHIWGKELRRKSSQLREG